MLIFRVFHATFTFVCIPCYFHFLYILNSTVKMLCDRKMDFTSTTPHTVLWVTVVSHEIPSSFATGAALVDCINFSFFIPERS